MQRGAITMYVLLVIVLVVLAAVALGAILADRLTPKGRGTPSYALPLAPAATELDRSLAPLLAAHPGLTGTVLINNGLDAFTARVLPARAAGRSLDLQYYIWHDDLTGRLLALEAWQAAELGVRVRILLDDTNSHGHDKQLLALDAHPNIEVRVYNPFHNRSGPRRLLELLVRALRVNHRMHNKAWIADGRIAVIGGRNIGDEYFSAAADTNFRDLDLLLTGPAVAEAEAIFDDFWNNAAVVPIRQLARADDLRLTALIKDAQAKTLSPAAQAYLERVKSSPGARDYLARQLRTYWIKDIHVMSDPVQKWRCDDRGNWLAGRIADEIASAGHTAFLISPYFVPGKRGTAELVKLEQSGVTVGIVTNSLAANDVPAAHSGYAHYRKPLLAGGVRLYELRAQGTPSTARLFGSSGASLHTKAFALDSTRGFVGSFNLDPRSANLNTEMGVLFEDPGLGEALRAEYQRLASAAQSYAVALDDKGRLHWEDRNTQPPTRINREPDAGLGRRLLARLLGWLPIESQL